MMIKYLALSLAILGACQTHKSTSNLDAAQFYEMQYKLDNEILVDVRTEEEYKEGAIDNAILLDIHDEETFKKYFLNIDKDTPILLYCRSGKRSETAKTILEDMGFMRVSDLDGGYISWQDFINKKGSD